MYTGGYLVRKTDQVNDYTNYARGSYGDYYQCTGGTDTVATKNGAGIAQPVRCYSAATSWHDQTTNTHLTQELRLSTPDDLDSSRPVRCVLRGLQDPRRHGFQLQDGPVRTPANLAASDAGGAPCVGNVGPLAGTTASEPGIRGDSTAFGEDLQRGYKQTAFFGSFDYDLIPKTLSITGGTRWYHYSEYETGSEYYTSTSCANVPNGLSRPGKNLNAATSTRPTTGSAAAATSPGTSPTT